MEVRVNEPLLRGYIEALWSVSEKFALSDDMTLMSVCRLPEVLSVSRREVDGDELSAGLVEIAEEGARPNTTRCANARAPGSATTCSRA